MHQLVRRARAALVIAVLWGLLWAVGGLAIGVLLGIQASPYPVLPDVGQWWFEWHRLVLTNAQLWAEGGALAGAVFAGAMTVAERGRTVRTLSHARAVGWGSIAGLVLLATGLAWLEVRRHAGATVILPGFPVRTLAVLLTLGAGCAWLTIALARRSALPAADPLGVVGGTERQAIGAGGVSHTRAEARSRTPVT
jgi:hypothetical protein